jgi:hypothetical protein
MFHCRTVAGHKELLILTDLSQPTLVRVSGKPESASPTVLQSIPRTVDISMMYVAFDGRYDDALSIQDRASMYAED